MKWVQLMVNISAALVGLGAASWFIQGRWWEGGGLLLLAILLYVPNWLYRRLVGLKEVIHPSVKETVEIILTAVVLINAAGYLWLFNEYILNVGYDTIVHFIGTVLVVFLFITIYIAVHWYVKHQPVTHHQLILGAIISGVSLGLLWELLEWTSDRLLGSRIYPGTYFLLFGQSGEPYDTLYDILADLLGTMVATVAINKYVPVFKYWQIFRNYIKDNPYYNHKTITQGRVD